MSVSSLVRTVVISNPVAGEYKFEIYEDEDALFYADISRKNLEGVWIIGWDGYRFSRALDVKEAVAGSIKFVDNLATDHNEIEARKRIS